MLLFGLEGSGFIISLALTLLIAGAIMFYCLKRFKILESSILEQGKVLQTFIIKNQNLDMNNNLAAPGALEAAREHTKTIDINANKKIEVSDDDIPQSSDSEYTDESSDEEKLEITDTIPISDNELLGGVKIIAMTNIDQGLTELLNSSASEKEETINLNLLENVITDITDLNSLDNNDDPNDDEVSKKDNNNDDEDDAENPEAKLSKLKSLKVSELKELVVKKNIASQDSVKQMKKEQLLNLLSEN